MYEQFGALVGGGSGMVTFKLFHPDGERNPAQYEGGGLPRLADVSVLGSFQNPATKQWDPDAPVRLRPSDFYDAGVLKGTVYSATVGPLPEGFYEYKYRVSFENGQTRYLTDPCARYGGSDKENAGFVVGGADEIVRAIGKRLPHRDLRIYELMIDDFTALIRRSDEAPLQTIVRKLDYLADLGVNAIEFMPWTAWSYRDDQARQDFSWGYNPIQYFSVAHKYTFNPSSDADKLVYLKRLINECHRRDIHVIMDGVFNHADVTPPERGFPYYWLYQDTADSPYVGNFAQADFFKDLDYVNACTLEYIRDACIYWIDEFNIDGIRLDNTLGLYRAGDRGHGLPKLLSELRGYLSSRRIENFSLILEHSWDYSAIDVTNKVGATSCWLDQYRSQSMDYLGNRPQGTPQIEPAIVRMLDSGRDFDAGRAPTIYIENHDHRRFMLKAGSRELWYLTQPYAIALFTCAGATLIYNGQEFGQCNDMPESGDGRVVPRPVLWELASSTPGPELIDLHRRLMAVRDAHPALRSSNFHPRGWHEDWTVPDRDGYGIDRARNVVVYHRWDQDDARGLERYYVVLNFSGQAQSVAFRVPEAGPWQDLLGGPAVTASDGWLSAVVNSNWGTIFYRPRQ